MRYDGSGPLKVDSATWQRPWSFRSPTCTKEIDKSAGQGYSLPKYGYSVVSYIVSSESDESHTISHPHTEGAGPRESGKRAPFIRIHTIHKAYNERGGQ